MLCCGNLCDTVLPMEGELSSYQIYIRMYAMVHTQQLFKGHSREKTKEKEREKERER